MNSKSKAVFFGLIFTVGNGFGAVKSGLDVWEEKGFAPLRGKRVGVIVNRTAVDARGKNIVDVLLKTPEVRVGAVFSPEHGFTGREEHGRKISNGFYGGTSIPLYSLYGETRRPTQEMLKDLDILVFDIQDVGVRFYTYITTMGYALEEAARNNLEFIVLDRPNPLGGDVVEGEALDPSVRHFTGYYSIPTRHGMTVGEIARFHNERSRLGGDLTVVSLEGWRRSMTWKETGLKFIPPSPNIPTPRAALLYAGVGAFESTNVAVGRGTKTPFEVFGAPWMDGKKIAEALNSFRMPGVKFKAVSFVPRKDRYAGEKCFGVRVIVTDDKSARPVDIFVRAACFLREFSPKDFQPRWEEMPRVTGSTEFERLYKSGATADEILKRIHGSAAEFAEARNEYLIYP